MNIENLTSKQISDKLAENGIKMHFNSKREKLEEALNNLPITEGDNMEAVTEATQEIPTAVLITADQLDDIFHNGIDGWKATIQLTKDKYPKGGN